MGNLLGSLGGYMHEVFPEFRDFRETGPRAGGKGDSHMKGEGMLVVSLRGVNFGFWAK